MERRNFRQRGLKKSIARAGKRIEALKDLENRYSWCRLIVFFGGIGISFALYWVAETFSWASLGATLIIFNIVAYFHRRIKKSIKSYRIWQKIKSTQLARMMLDWENIPDSSFKLSGGCDHPFDLDFVTPCINYWISPYPMRVAVCWACGYWKECRTRQRLRSDSRLLKS
jgi:hypothetical protein